MKRKIIIVASVLAIIILAMVLNSVFSSLNPEQQMNVMPKAKKHVRTASVKYSEIESQVSASGRIVSQSFVDVSSEVQGKILPGHIALKKGQAFNKGDLLLQIYSKEFELALQSKKSRFLTSIANILPDFKIDYPENYSAWSKFFDEIKIDRKMPALPSLKSKQEKVFLASKNILSDYYSIQSDEIRLDKYKIRAPFKGVYTQVNSEVGSIANPGVRLGQIIRTDQLELEVPVKTNDIKWLNKGDKAIVSTEDGLMKWNGKVVRISEFVDENTQSISVFVSITPDKNQKLFNGQYLKAVFPGKITQAGMEIPRNAVFNFNEVFTVVEGKLKKKIITIEKFNQNSLIVSGLPEGIDVVTEPLINAIENTEVEAIRKSGISGQ